MEGKRIRKFRFIVTLIFTLLVSLILPKATYANTSNQLGKLVKIKKYEKAGYSVTEKIYFKPDNSRANFTTMLRGGHGQGWYTKESTYTWNAKDPKKAHDMTYYATGYFTWGNGDVSVSNARGGHSALTGKEKIRDESVTTGTGKRFFIFEKYAYVKYSFKAVSMFEVGTNLSVSVEVEEDGDCN